MNRTYNVYAINATAMARYQRPEMDILGTVEAKNGEDALQAGKKFTPAPIVESHEAIKSRLADATSKAEYDDMIRRMTGKPTVQPKSPVAAKIASTPALKFPNKPALPSKRPVKFDDRELAAKQRPATGQPRTTTQQPVVRRTQFGAKPVKK